MTKSSMLCLLIALCVSLSFSGELLPFPFVYAEGRADTSVAPNTALVTFWVNEINELSSKAMETVEKKSDEIIKMLTANGIKSENITAHALSKDIKSDFDNHEMKILGYEITRKFEIKIEDISLYTAIAPPLFAMDNIDGLWVTFSRDDKARIDAALLLKACKNARENADQLAGSLNAIVKCLYAVSKSEFYTLPTKFGLEDDSKGSQTSSSHTQVFMPRTIDIHSEINTIFKLKE
jgi:uncharacterized protein YggE